MFHAKRSPGVDGSGDTREVLTPIAVLGYICHEIKKPRWVRGF